MTLVARKPLVSFFVLAYGLSWVYWIPLALAGVRTAPGSTATHEPGLLGGMAHAGILHRRDVRTTTVPMIIRGFGLGLCGCAIVLSRSQAASRMSQLRKASSAASHHFGFAFIRAQFGVMFYPDRRSP